MKFLIIDGSYFNFFRFYAVKQWFKFVNPDITLDDPISNKEFVEKFRITFISKIKEIQEKLKWKTCVKIVAKDCPRKEIWRNKYYKNYKISRDKNNDFKGGPLFKLAYDELYKLSGIQSIISYPTLEADDCAAITTKYILETQPNAEIVIITGDMDYLQLANEQVTIMNLKYQDLSKSKNATGDAECDKFCKIVCGDKSDDISGVFKKCGIKTALKLYENKEEFETKLNTEEGAREKYDLNKLLVDFNMIPDELVNGFKREILLASV